MLLLGLPFSIAGSLSIAILLSRKLHFGSARSKSTVLVILSAGVLVGTGILVAAGASQMTYLAVGLFALSLFLGVLFGGSVYRTLLYLPSFTSGVATILLWKNLLNPNTGPVNRALTPVIECVGRMVNVCPSWVFIIGMSTMLLSSMLVLNRSIGRGWDAWSDGEIGTATNFAVNVLALSPAAIFATMAGSTIS